jgi:hypothetical protein
MNTANTDPTENLLRENEQAAWDVDEEENQPIQSSPRGLSGFVRTQVEINKAIVERLDTINKKVGRIQDDIGIVKGGHARNEAIRDARLITFDLGMEYLRTVEGDELAELSQAHSNIGIEGSDLRSFRQADLVIEASRDSGKTYIVVEVSFTADKRDTERAIRNADFLRRFTGCEAAAVVASVKNDYDVAQQVEQKLIHWHQIDERALRAD